MSGQRYTSTMCMDIVDRIHRRKIRVFVSAFDDLRCRIYVPLLEDGVLRYAELTANLDNGTVEGMNKYPWWITEKSLARVRRFLLSKPFHEQFVSVLVDAILRRTGDQYDGTVTECLRQVVASRHLFWAESVIFQYRQAILDRAYADAIESICSSETAETLERLMAAEVFFERGLPCDG